MVNFLELHRSQLLHLLLQLPGIITSILTNFLSVHPFLVRKYFLTKDISTSSKQGFLPLFKTMACNLIKAIFCKMIVAIEWFNSQVTIQAAMVHQISKVNFKKYIKVPIKTKRTEAIIITARSPLSLRGITNTPAKVLNYNMAYSSKPLIMSQTKILLNSS
jgi:hypothetical protein